MDQLEQRIIWIIGRYGQEIIGMPGAQPDRKTLGGLRRHEALRRECADDQREQREGVKRRFGFQEPGEGEVPSHGIGGRYIARWKQLLAF